MSIWRTYIIELIGEMVYDFPLFRVLRLYLPGSSNAVASCRLGRYNLSTLFIGGLIDERKLLMPRARDNGGHMHENKSNLPRVTIPLPIKGNNFR